jgi:putative heme transporter
MPSQAGPGPAPDVSPDPAAEPSEPAARGRLARIVRNKRIVRAVGVLVVVALVYYAFFVVLPSEISWSQVEAALKALSAQEVAALLLAGLVVMVTLGWASKASMPGMGLYQGFEASATSQMTAFVIPPPGQMVVQFGMYRTYGFTDEKSGVGVVLATVWWYVVVALMPILGLLAYAVTGRADAAQLWWLAGLGVAFVVVVVLLLKVVRSDAAAHTVGRVLQRVVSRVMTAVRRHPAEDLERSVVEFSGRMRGTVATRWRSLTAANLAWALASFLVLLMAIRFSGLDAQAVPLVPAFLAMGLLLVVNLLPIPGKNALIAPALFTLLALTTDAEQSALTAALLLYRVITWILPIFVGGTTFFAWRYRVRRDVVTVDSADDVDATDPA